MYSKFITKLVFSGVVNYDNFLPVLVFLLYGLMKKRSLASSRFYVLNSASLNLDTIDFAQKEVIAAVFRNINIFDDLAISDEIHKQLSGKNTHEKIEFSNYFSEVKADLDRIYEQVVFRGEDAVREAKRVINKQKISYLLDIAKVLTPLESIPKDGICDRISKKGGIIRIYLHGIDMIIFCPTFINYTIAMLFTNDHLQERKKCNTRNSTHGTLYKYTDPKPDSAKSVLGVPNLKHYNYDISRFSLGHPKVQQQLKRFEREAALPVLGTESSVINIPDSEFDSNINFWKHAKWYDNKQNEEHKITTYGSFASEVDIGETLKYTESTDPLKKLKITKIATDSRIDSDGEDYRLPLKAVLCGAPPEPNSTKTTALLQDIEACKKLPECDLLEILELKSVKEQHEEIQNSILSSILSTESAYSRRVRETFASNVLTTQKYLPDFTRVCKHGSYAACNETYIKNLEKQKKALSDIKAIELSVATGVVNQVRPFNPCQLMHYRKIIVPWTDESLGDCTYLDTCRNLGTCKHLHYSADLTAAQRYILNMKKTEKLNFQLFSGRNYAPQWINCDIRTFPMHIFQGYVDVIMADPPWDIHMELPYGTMADNEMRNMRVQDIQRNGIIFLWITGRAMELGRECLKKWGYDLIDELVWVKTNQLNRLIRTGRTGHWLNHSKEHCLIGIKGRIKLNGNLDCNTIISEVRETSRKPDEIYHLIERLAPCSLKLELFGRQHNTTNNWITLGNQLNGVQLHHPILKARYQMEVDKATV